MPGLVRPGERTRLVPESLHQARGWAAKRRASPCAAPIISAAAASQLFIRTSAVVKISAGSRPSSATSQRQTCRAASRWRVPAQVRKGIREVAGSLVALEEFQALFVKARAVERFGQRIGRLRRAPRPAELPPQAQHGLANPIFGKASRRVESRSKPHRLGRGLRSVRGGEISRYPWLNHIQQERLLCLRAVDTKHRGVESRAERHPRDVIRTCCALWSARRDEAGSRTVDHHCDAGIVEQSEFDDSRRRAPEIRPLAGWTP